MDGHHFSFLFSFVTWIVKANWDAFVGVCTWNKAHVVKTYAIKLKWVNCVNVIKWLVGFQFETTIKSPFSKWVWFSFRADFLRTQTTQQTHIVRSSGFFFFFVRTFALMAEKAFYWFSHFATKAFTKMEFLVVFPILFFCGWNFSLKSAPICGMWIIFLCAPSRKKNVPWQWKWWKSFMAVDQSIFVRLIEYACVPAVFHSHSLPVLLWQLGGANEGCTNQFQNYNAAISRCHIISHKRSTDDERDWRSQALASSFSVCSAGEAGSTNFS